MEEEKKGIDRRQFLRRAAVGTAAAAWATPIIQTVAASPAYAIATPPPESDHSLCVAACNEAVSHENQECKRGGGCNDLCFGLCPPGGSCCNPALVGAGGWNDDCTPAVTC